ncbi:MAG: signal peptidase I [Eubacterium sp.]|nr:signal peptidase I [Candidatus Colimonas fimequi]
MANKRMMSRYDGRKLGWFRFAKLIGIVVIATLVVFNVIVGVSRVSGESMNPTLEDNQVVFYLRLSDNYHNGDIVSIKMPNGDKYVKRIIASPGDTIDISDGAVTVNGQVLSEEYAQGITDKGIYEISYPYQVEQDMFFVLGDNRESSVDSRTFGPVVRSSIKGSLLFQ